MNISLASVEPMHIPDGFLSITVSVFMWIVSIILVGYALRRVSADMDERKVPLMGVLAAAIFAGQMLNFTVIGGTSGHLMGAALATILLGPWAAILVMTTVVGVQALIFQDGGLLVLGANIFNMAILGVAVSYAVYSLFQKLASGRKPILLAGAFISGWLSIVVTSLSVAIQLVVSGTSPAILAIPAMVGVHVLIGIGEALITVGALVLISTSRPDLLNDQNNRSLSWSLFLVLGFFLALALVFISPLASTNPDGLEWVAKQGGFLETAREPFYNILPDYNLPGIQNQSIATIAAGIIGTLVVLAVALVVAFSRRVRKPK
ncbi:energy-coupling factor ABC transporter permease [Chloroflexota bacterium]